MDNQAILELVIYNNDAELLEKTMQSIGDLPYIMIDASEAEDELEAFRLSQSRVSGKYIWFLVAGDNIEKKSDINRLKRALATGQDGLYSMKRFSEELPLKYNNGQLDIDLDDPKTAQFCELDLSRFCIPKEEYIALDPDDEVPEEALTRSMVGLLMKYKKYTAVIGRKYSNRPNIRSYYTYPAAFNKDYYIPSMQGYLKDLVKNNHERYIQYMAMYLIQIRYAVNLNARDKSVLLPDEAREFFKATSEVLQFIDDDIILTNNIPGWRVVPEYLCYDLFRLKYNDFSINPEYSIEDIFEKDPLRIRVMDYDGEMLLMDGRFNLAWALPEFDLYYRINGERKELRLNEAYTLEKVFNITIKKDQAFQLQIPVSAFDKKTEFAFYVSVNGKETILQTGFERPMSKLNNIFKCCYFAFGNNILSYNAKKCTFTVTHKNSAKIFFREAALMANFLFPDRNALNRGRRRVAFKRGIKLLMFRGGYWLTRGKFHKKPVWITQDKLYKGGDNAEYLYRYIKDNHLDTDFDIYYVIDGDAPDYKRLSAKYDTVIVFNSMKHKLLAMNCDMMLATHVDTLNCNGFYADTRPYVMDLYTPRIVCLTHGMTVQQIAQYQNRTFDNTNYYFLVSKYEVENLKKPIYDYYDDSKLFITGHGRFDGLISNDKRQILITPTWRRSLTTGKAKKGSMYDHNDGFKHSDYYKIYNGLLNDRRLLECAAKTGYKIIYLLHPALSAQLEDFEVRDDVEITKVSEISYEQILTESSLMVTDYSGVQFDFAYQKKPLVYYHPEVLPPQYEEGIFFYDSMGFGEVCTDHESIVKLLCEYMENNCQMKPEYIARVEDFFEYDDHNNCKREFAVLREIFEDLKTKKMIKKPFKG